VPPTLAAEPVPEPKIQVPIKTKEELMIEERMASLAGGADQPTEPLQKAFLKIKERSTEQVSEDDLRAFTQLVVPNKKTLLQIVSVRHTVAQREPGVAKAFSEIVSNSKSNNNF